MSQGETYGIIVGIALFIGGIAFVVLGKSSSNLNKSNTNNNSMMNVSAKDSYPQMNKEMNPFKSTRGGKGRNKKSRSSRKK
jgi:hypothetical protein